MAGIEKKAESHPIEVLEPRDELIRSERLAFTGRIAANIAHEIRNHLTNISMSLQELQRKINPESSAAELVGIIARNTERIDFLIKELLNCARPPKLNLKPCDLNGILRKILKANQNRIKSQKIEVVRNFGSKPPNVQVDKDQIERVLSNIIINSIDAMPKGGKLTILTEYNGKSLSIQIQDTGRGISNEDVIKVFDPFFSTKKSGIGLGLTICYGIITSHGGTVELESKPRKGTVFTVTLPI